MKPGKDGRVTTDLSRFKFDTTFARPPPTDDGKSTATFETVYPMYPRHQRNDNVDPAYSPPEIPIPPRKIDMVSPEASPRNNFEQAFPLPEIVVDTPGGRSPQARLQEPVHVQASPKTHEPQASNRSPNTELPREPMPSEMAEQSLRPGQTILIPSANGEYQKAIVDVNGQIHTLGHPQSSPSQLIDNHKSSAMNSYYNLGKKHKVDPEKQSVSSFKQNLELTLLSNVMNTPVCSFRTRGIYKDAPEQARITITTSFIVYVFEIIFGIVSITLSSILANKDHSFPDGIYRYMIADSVISLAVALLFIFKIINFERRNGSFYCTVAAIMKFVSFVMVTSTVIPASCPSKHVCDLRRAVSSFTIISTFLWEGHLVMFLTTLYISRLNLLDDINFDYSNKGASKKYNAPSEKKLCHPVTGELLKEYYLNEEGEMFEIEPGTDMSDKNMIIVYTF